MNENIQIDPEFQSLVPALTREEYKQLEDNLLQDGCREPISLWEGIILDGHHRYEICMKHGLPFTTRTLPLRDRDEAIIWICSNQMGRRNLTEEQRHYLIGKRYEAEKRMGAPNPAGNNQYQRSDEVAPKVWVQPGVKPPSRRMTAYRIAQEYHIGAASVEHYHRYTQAMDRIAKVDDQFVKLVLNNTIRLSVINAIKLSRLSDEEIYAVTSKIRPSMPFHLDEDEIISLLRSVKHSTAHFDQSAPATPPVTVKTMPKYDPDAEASSLALTIPSWRSSIERVQQKANLGGISAGARSSLESELISLRSTIDGVLIVMGAIQHE